MAKDKREIINNINSNLKKINTEKLLSMDFMKNEFNMKLLKGQLAGPSDNYKEINTSINEFYSVETLELYIEMKNAVNNLISDELVDSITTFNNLQTQVGRINEEISDLKRKKFHVDISDDITSKMKSMEIDIEIKKKKDELEKIKEAYIHEYERGLTNTILPKDLALVADEITRINNEYVNEINEEIENYSNRILVLKRLKNNFSLRDDFKVMISEKFGVGSSMADIAISSSEKQVPFIQSQVK